MRWNFVVQQKIFARFYYDTQKAFGSENYFFFDFLKLHSVRSPLLKLISIFSYFESNIIVLKIGIQFFGRFDIDYDKVARQNLSCFKKFNWLYNLSIRLNTYLSTSQSFLIKTLFKREHFFNYHVQFGFIWWGNNLKIAEIIF